MKRSIELLTTLKMIADEESLEDDVYSIYRCMQKCSIEFAMHKDALDQKSNQNKMTAHFHTMSFSC